MENGKHQAPPAGNESEKNRTTSTRDEQQGQVEQPQRGDIEPAKDKSSRYHRPNDNRNQHEYTDINKSNSKDTLHPEEKDSTV